jgi:hypothetical protein
MSATVGENHSYMSFGMVFNAPISSKNEEFQLGKIPILVDMNTIMATLRIYFLKKVHTLNG